MDDLWTEINQKRTELSTAVSIVRKTSQAKAKAEREYQVAKRVEVMKLRDQGMPIGQIDLIVRGIPEIAELREKRDIAIGNYEASREYVNVLKIEIRLLDAQISREWSQSGMSGI